MSDLPPGPGPRRIVMVAAYARNRVIGDRGAIPWHVPEDFAHFKRVTLGHTLVMGRATWDSIGRPLPGRTTVVVTRDRDWTAGEYADQVHVAHSVQAAIDLAATLPGDTVIAGGTQVYEQAMPLATHQVLTEIDQAPDGDAHYPELPVGEWKEVSREEHDGHAFTEWERIAPPPTIDVAAVALFRDDEVLTVRKRGTERFMLVGGKLEPGESGAMAARRETAEEVRLRPQDLAPIGEFTTLAANEPGHLVRAQVFTAAAGGVPEVAAEIAELRWMRLTEAHDDLAPLLESLLPVLGQPE